jgi:hypothetical protein
MSNSQNYLCYEKPALFFSKPLHSIEMTEELTSFDKSHKEINSEVILENEIHADNEWMFNIVQNIFFKL